MRTVRVLQYIAQLDAFLVTDEYRALAHRLGLAEWNPMVWLGRLFTLDNDYGKHWFDNGEEREAVAARATVLGIDTADLMIINPERFKNDADGPCHPPELRKKFWTDVLTSLKLSDALLFAATRFWDTSIHEIIPDEYIPELEERIAALEAHGASDSP
jgi:hypothetical protein